MVSSLSPRTSESTRQWILAGLTVSANRPPLTLERCFRTVLISEIVAPDFRRRGIGAKLIQAGISLALKDNCPIVAVQTTPIMADAVKLFEKSGFRVAKILGEKDGVQWFVYCKAL